MFCFMFLDGIYLLNGDDVAGYVGPLQIYLLEDYYLSVLFIAWFRLYIMVNLFMLSVHI